MNWHTLTSNEALRELDAAPDTGLSTAAAAAREKTWGKNILEAKKVKACSPDSYPNSRIL